MWGLAIRMRFVVLCSLVFWASNLDLPASRSWLSMFFGHRFRAPGIEL